MRSWGFVILAAAAVIFVFLDKGIGLIFAVLAGTMIVGSR